MLNHGGVLKDCICEIIMIPSLNLHIRKLIEKIYHIENC